MASPQGSIPATVSFFVEKSRLRGEFLPKVGFPAEQTRLLSIVDNFKKTRKYRIKRGFCESVMLKFFA
jgi:hypothetical protein